MDMKLCKRVSKFKMVDSKAPPEACQNPPKFCLDEFSVTTGKIVLKFGDMIDMDYEVLQEGFKGYPRVPWGHAPPSS